MISANYTDHHTPTYRVLSEGQCQELYWATLECLQRVGVIVHSASGRELLAKAGARVDATRVFIPPHIIQDTVAATPHTFTLYGRAGRPDLPIAPGRVFFGPGPSCTFTTDLESGQRRKSQRGDAANTARLVDRLENIDYAMSLSLFDDVTPMLSPVYEFAEMLQATGKPIVAWANDLDTLQDIHKIAAAAVGGEAALRQRPIFAYFANYESPLRHGEKQIDNLLWAAQHDIPVVYLGGPTVGLEAPVTGASALVVYLAAALSGLAMIQLQRRGAAAMIGGLPSAMDLRTARPAYGSPEMVLHVAAAAELARFLGLPFMGTAGASESKLVDAQAGVEIGLQIFSSALSGGGLVHDVGFLDCADIGSLALLTLADEVIAMVKRIMRGITVNRSTIMMDLLEKVGPGGHFMAEPQSATLCRREIWVPGVLERNAYAIWEKKGSQTLEARLDQRLRKLLSEHTPPVLAPGAEAAITTILHAAEQRYQ